MRFTIPAFIAGLAVVSQAFLLPPSISSSDTDIVNTLPFEVESEAIGQALDLPCMKCPVATSQGWVRDVESKLRLQFSIHDDIDTDKLYLNGFQIYPAQVAQSDPLTALQLAANADENSFLPNLRLGYELRITPVVKSEQDQLELINIQLQIIEIANKFVDGLESVELKLLKTPSGKLMIGDLKTAPTTNPGSKDCKSLVCKLRVILANKLGQLKPKKGGCMKTRPHKAASHPEGGRHGHGSHGPHRHHNHHGLARFFHALKSIALHILIPVFIGVVAGFTASLIGMIVGQAVVFLWRTFYRRGRKGAYSKVQQDETTVSRKGGDEAQAFLEHQGPPPVYEDVVVDEKSVE
jgi:hypothetical protein